MGPGLTAIKNKEGDTMFEIILGILGAIGIVGLTIAGSALGVPALIVAAHVAIVAIVVAAVNF